MERDGNRCNLSCLGPRALVALYRNAPERTAPCRHAVRRLYSLLVVVKGHWSVLQALCPIKNPQISPRPKRNRDKAEERFSQETEMKTKVEAARAVGKGQDVPYRAALHDRHPPHSPTPTPEIVCASSARGLEFHQGWVRNVNEQLVSS